MSTASNLPPLPVGAHPVAVRRRLPSTSRPPSPRTPLAHSRRPIGLLTCYTLQGRVPATAALVRRPATATPRESKRPYTRPDVSRRAVTRIPTRYARVCSGMTVSYILYTHIGTNAGVSSLVLFAIITIRVYTHAVPARPTVFRPRRRDDARRVYA